MTGINPPLHNEADIIVPFDSKSRLHPDSCLFKSWNLKWRVRVLIMKRHDNLINGHQILSIQRRKYIVVSWHIEWWYLFVKHTHSSHLQQNAVVWWDQRWVITAEARLWTSPWPWWQSILAANGLLPQWDDTSQIKYGVLGRTTPYQKNLTNSKRENVALLTVLWWCLIN